VVDGAELGDPTGQLWNAMTAHGVRFLVVRPDRYVYAATADAHAIAPPVFAATAPNTDERVDLSVR
jgi:3-(3-hydroxy-phenyl)propionate hydroxylase